MFRLAMYKGKGNLFNALIRFWDSGVYSHCELVFSDGMSASASYRDSQEVRLKFIDFSVDTDNWDFYDLPDHLEPAARQFLNETRGKGYDLIGQLRFFFSPYHGQKKKYWCSEWIAAALGMKDPWRYGPNGLNAAITLLKV
jgi:hypothetical protein